MSKLTDRPKEVKGLTQDHCQYHMTDLELGIINALEITLIQFKLSTTKIEKVVAEIHFNELPEVS